jgi:CheY-like chemotaxis protein
MSGLELCRELRGGIANRGLYLMMLSASDRPEDLDLSRAAGADAYVRTSAQTKEIIARMATARHITQLQGWPQ